MQTRSYILLEISFNLKKKCIKSQFQHTQKREKNNIYPNFKSIREYVLTLKYTISIILIAVFRYNLLILKG